MTDKKYFSEKFFRIATGLGIVMFFAAGFSVFIIVFGGMSRVPDASSGHVFPFNQHGTIVYVSWLQNFISHFAWPIGAIGFVLAAIGRKMRNKNFLGKWAD